LWSFGAGFVRIGLYGGTFDPVHLGHIHAAQCVQQRLNLDRVHMILSARPSHRDQPQTPNDHRWKMLQLACAEHEKLQADDSELRRPGKSYAVDTLRAFRQQNPDAQLCWILGMDSYRTLPTWQNWRELLQYGHLVVVHRPGPIAESDTDPVLNAFEQRHRAESIDGALAGKIAFLSLPMMAVSASQIRCRRSAGESDQALLDPLVWSYINQHQLYLTQEG